MISIEVRIASHGNEAWHGVTCHLAGKGIELPHVIVSHEVVGPGHPSYYSSCKQVQGHGYSNSILDIWAGVYQLSLTSKAKVLFVLLGKGRSTLVLTMVQLGLQDDQALV